MSMIFFLICILLNKVICYKIYTFEDENIHSQYIRIILNWSFWKVSVYFFSVLKFWSINEIQSFVWMKAQIPNDYWKMIKTQIWPLGLLMNIRVFGFVAIAIKVELNEFKVLFDFLKENPQKTVMSA